MGTTERARTHYEGCWRNPSHHACAVRRIEELEDRPDSGERGGQDICPVCEERPTSRANSLHGHKLLPCPVCKKLIYEGADRILEAFQTVARGGAFGTDCARSAARDILHDALTDRPSSTQEAGEEVWTGHVEPEELSDRDLGSLVVLYASLLEDSGQHATMLTEAARRLRTTHTEEKDMHEDYEILAMTKAKVVQTASGAVGIVIPYEMTAPVGDEDLGAEIEVEIVRRHQPTDDGRNDA